MTTTSATLLSPTSASSTGIGWLLLSVGMALPWLFPIHALPWTTFHTEWLMALAVVPLAVWAVGAGWSRGPPAVDRAAAVFGLAALVPLAQAAAGQLIHPGEAPLVAMYLVGMALMVAVGRHAEAVAPGRLPDALMTGLVIAALVSTGIALAQSAGVVPRESLFLSQPGPDGRAWGNLAQPNQLATLLAWGIVGVWWAHAHRRLGAVVALFAAAVLLLGVAASQSRTGWVCVAVLGVAALTEARRQRSTRMALCVALLAAWFVLLVLGWEAARQALPGDAGRSLQAQLSVGKRPMIWQMMWEGVLARPWFGYGWNQGLLVHLDLFESYPSLRIQTQHAHSLLLDLMVWNGLPLGLLFSGLLLVWFGWHASRLATLPDRLLWLALVVLLVHALLELPHTMAHLLIPAALMMGVLNARHALPTVLALPWAVAAALVAVLATGVVLIGVDYLRIERDLESYRMRAARIGDGRVPPLPDIRVLHALQGALVSLRAEPRAGMPADELERMRRTLARWPVPSGMMAYACAAALNGQPAEATRALRTLCGISPAQACDDARRHWQAATAEQPVLAAVPFPVP